VSTSPETELPEFQRQQLAFTGHIRDPENSARPAAIPARRMAIYTELFFNNINEQLSSNFPVLRQITSDERWHAMVRDFMIRHRSQTPLFTEIGQEFLEYLQQRLRSYFREGVERSSRVQQILDRLFSFDYEASGSELEAMLRAGPNAEVQCQILPTFDWSALWLGQLQRRVGRRARYGQT